ncbi:hypothetical protein PINS_up019102 [Pythium insidiosum]|nr:hypothetical protein PINS_up019102 [Pythium insidiosum]
MHARHHSNHSAGSGIISVDLEDDFQRLQLRDPYGTLYEERSSLSRSNERQLPRKYSHSSNGSGTGGREVSTGTIYPASGYPYPQTHSAQPYYPHPGLGARAHVVGLVLLDGVVVGVLDL